MRGRISCLVKGPARMHRARPIPDDLGLRKSGEAWRRSGLMREIARRSRQGAIRHRPMKSCPLNGRHAECNGPRRYRRCTVGKRLAKRTVVMPMRMARRLLPTAVAIRGLQADFAHTEAVDPMCGDDAIRDRREGLYGQRQRKKDNRQQATGHKETRLSLEMREIRLHVIEAKSDPRRKRSGQETRFSLQIPCAASAQGMQLPVRT